MGVLGVCGVMGCLGNYFMLKRSVRGAQANNCTNRERREGG